MISYTNLLLILAALVNFILGLTVYFYDRRNKINITFFILVLCTVQWIVSIYFLWNSTDPDIAFIWGKLSFFGPTLLPVVLIYFSYIFPNEKKKITLRRIILLLIPSIIVYVFVFSNLIINGVEIVKWGSNVKLASLFIVFPIYFLLYIFYGFYNLILQYKRNEGKWLERLQIKYLFFGFILSSILGLLLNVIMPIFGISTLVGLGPLTTVFLIVFTSYAIVKHQLFNIRVIATELLVGLVGLLLLFDVMSSKLPGLIALKSFILLVFIYFGYELIKSVLREIQRREEIEKIDRAKSEFISIASHQLRTPLAAVKGYISMVLEGTYGILAEKIKRPLENVYNSNERLIRLVNDLLNLSRLDAGKIEFSPELTSLEEMVFGIVEELRINAEKKGLYMKMIKPSELLPKIMVDQDKIRQVILNIVDNAIKYTKEGGITFELKKLDEQEEIKVSDTGEGMDERELNSLFQMFSRATAGTQLHAEGAGLGLYVARQFIEMHGGKIWAESPGKGKGSAFIIQLPIKLDLKLIKEKTRIITKAPNDIF